MSSDTPAAAPERIELPGGYSLVFVDHYDVEIQNKADDFLGTFVTEEDARAFAAAIAGQPAHGAPPVPDTPVVWMGRDQYLALTAGSEPVAAQPAPDATPQPSTDEPFGFVYRPGGLTPWVFSQQRPTGVKIVKALYDRPAAAQASPVAWRWRRNWWITDVWELTDDAEPDPARLLTHGDKAITVESLYTQPLQITQAMRDAGLAARDAALAYDVNDQIGAFNAGLDAALAAVEQDNG